MLANLDAADCYLRALLEALNFFCVGISVIFNQMSFVFFVRKKSIFYFHILLYETKVDPLKGWTIINM